MAVRFADYVMIFYAYSLLGWCMEVIYMGIREKKLTNRGFLLGPFCPIYGIGLSVITMLFQDRLEHFIYVFFSIILLCSLLEYLVSYLLERIFHTRWWDYHDMRFNLRGRICLETMLPFGVLGSIALYRINPLLMRFFHHMPSEISSKLMAGLVLMTLADVVVSVSLLFHLTLPQGEADHTAEISRRVRHAIEKQLERVHIK